MRFLLFFGYKTLQLPSPALRRWPRLWVRLSHKIRVLIVKFYLFIFSNNMVSGRRPLTMLCNALQKGIAMVWNRPWNFDILRRVHACVRASVPAWQRRPCNTKMSPICRAQRILRALCKVICEACAKQYLDTRACFYFGARRAATLIISRLVQVGCGHQQSIVVRVVAWRQLADYVYIIALTGC